jgi:hypothetical protein
VSQDPYRWEALWMFLARLFMEICSLRRTNQAL